MQHESTAMIVGGVAVRVSKDALSSGFISLKHSAAEQFFGAETLQTATDTSADGKHPLLLQTLPPGSFTLSVQLRVLQRTARPSNTPDGSPPPTTSLYCELCGLGTWLRGQGAVPGVHWVQLWRGAGGALRLRLCDGKPTSLPCEGVTAQQQHQQQDSSLGEPSRTAGLPCALGSVPEPGASLAVRAVMGLIGSAAQAVADAVAPWGSHNPACSARAASVRVAVGAAAELQQREAGMTERNAVAAAAATACTVAAAKTAAPQPWSVPTRVHSPSDARSGLLLVCPPAFGQGFVSVSSGAAVGHSWAAEALASPTPAQPYAGHGSDTGSTGNSLPISPTVTTQPPPRPPPPMLLTTRPRPSLRLPPVPPKPPQPPQPPRTQPPAAREPAGVHATAELQAFHRAVPAGQVITVDVCQIGRSQAGRLGANALKVWPEAFELRVKEARVVILHLVKRVPVRHGAAVYRTTAHTVAAKLLRWDVARFALTGLGQAGDTFSLGRDPSGKVWVVQQPPRPQPQLPPQQQQPQLLPQPPPLLPPPPPPMHCQQQQEQQRPAVAAVPEGPFGQVVAMDEHPGTAVGAGEDRVLQPRLPGEPLATRDQGPPDPQQQQQQQQQQRPEVQDGRQRSPAQQVQLPGKHLQDVSQAPPHVQQSQTPPPLSLLRHLPPPSLQPPSSSSPPPPPPPPPLLPQLPPPPPQPPLSSLPPSFPPPPLLPQQQRPRQQPSPPPPQQPSPPPPLHQPLLLQQEQQEQREEPEVLSLRGTVNQGRLNMQTTGASKFWGQELLQGPEGSAFVQLHVLRGAAAAGNAQGAGGLHRDMQEERMPSTVHTVRVIWARRSGARRSGTRLQWTISGGAPAVIRALGAVDRDRVLLTRLPDGKVTIQLADAGGEQEAGAAAGLPYDVLASARAQAQPAGEGPQRLAKRQGRGEASVAVELHQQQQRPELQGPVAQLQLSETHLQHASQAQCHMQGPQAEECLQEGVRAASVQAPGQGQAQGRQQQLLEKETWQHQPLSGDAGQLGSGGQQPSEVGPPEQQGEAERAAKRARLSEPPMAATVGKPLPLMEQHQQQDQQLACRAEPSGPADRVFAGVAGDNRVHLRVTVVPALWPEAAARMQHGQSREVVVHAAPAAGLPGDEGAGEQQQEQPGCFRLLLKLGIYPGNGRTWRLAGCGPLFRALGASTGDAIYLRRSPEDGRVIAQVERSPPPAPRQAEQHERRQQQQQDKAAPPQAAQQRPNRQHGSRQQQQEQQEQQQQQRQRQEEGQQGQRHVRQATPPSAGPTDRVFAGYKQRGRMDVKLAAVAELWPSALELRYGQATEVVVHAAAELAAAAAEGAAQLPGDGKAGEQQREDELAPFQLVLKLRLGPGNNPAWRMTGCLGLFRALGAGDGDAIYMWRLPGDGRIVAGMERRGSYGGKVQEDVPPAQQQQQKRKTMTTQQQGKGGAQRGTRESQDAIEGEDVDLDEHDSGGGEEEGHGRDEGWGFEGAGGVQRAGRAGALEAAAGCGDSTGDAGEEEEEEGEGEEEDLGGNCWLRAVAAESGLWEEGGWLGGEGEGGEGEAAEGEDAGMH